jgi:hypothetical protein
LPAPGVVPEAFDTQLIGSNPSEFVYRNLENTSVDIVAGDGGRVDNESTEMAMLQNIAPGKRVRGNIEKWASTSISLRGGRLDDSSGHPDAGKVFSFGNYKQKLTDAINFSSEQAMTIRVSSGVDVRTFATAAGDTTELWLVSAATPDSQYGDPTDLAHTEVLFEYLVDATPVHAVCADATGRAVPPTELPYVRPTNASMGIISSSPMFPPMSDICFVACILLGTVTSGN